MKAVAVSVSAPSGESGADLINSVAKTLGGIRDLFEHGYTSKGRAAVQKLNGETVSLAAILQKGALPQPGPDWEAHATVVTSARGAADRIVQLAGSGVDDVRQLALILKQREEDLLAVLE